MSNMQMEQNAHLSMISNQITQPTAIYLSFPFRPKNHLNMKNKYKSQHIL